MATPNLTGGITHAEYMRTGSVSYSHWFLGIGDLPGGARTAADGMRVVPVNDVNGDPIIPKVTGSTQTRVNHNVPGEWAGYTMFVGNDGAENYAPLDITTADTYVAILAALYSLGTPQHSVGKRTETIANNGFNFAVVDSGENYRVWTVFGNDVDNNRDFFQWLIIDPDYVGAAIYESATPPDLTDIKYISIFVNPSALGSLTTKDEFERFAVIQPYVFTGGNAGDKLNIGDLVTAAHGQVPNGSMWFDSFGAQYNVMGLIKLGDAGSSAFHCEDSNFALEFADVVGNDPTKVRNTIQQNKYGLIFDVTSDFDLVWSNFSIISPAQYRLEVNGNGNNTQSLSFRSGTIIGAGPSNLAAPFDAESCSFSGCGTITQQDARIAKSTVQGCADATGAIHYDGTGALSDVTFADNQVDIVIDASAPDDVDFSTLSFTNAPGDVNVIDMRSGTVTIAVGDSVPSIRNDGGGTTQTTVPPKTITAANLPAGTRVQIYNLSIDTEIDNAVVTGGAGYSIAITSEASVGHEIRLRAMYADGASYKEPLEVLGAMTTAGLSFINSLTDWAPLNQIAIDGSTCSEFVPDYPNLQVDISDGDNITTNTRLVAWYAWALTQEEGMRQIFGAIDVEDAANFKIMVHIVDFKLDNVKSTPLLIADGTRLYRSDGTTFIAATSNSIQTSAGKVYVTETGVSGLTTAESNLLNKLNGTLDANIKQVNDSAISGSGTAADPWGP